MRWNGLVVSTAILVWSRVADAEPDSPPPLGAFALVADASKEASTCADRDVLQARISERLGRDPFTKSADARGKLHVRFARRGARAWSADIELFDASEKRTGARTLQHEGTSCEPLVGSVVLTIAVLLEDLAPASPLPTPAPPPRTEPAPTSPLEWPPEPPLPQPPLPSRPIRFDVVLGGAGAVGAAPSPSIGGELGLGLDAGRLRFELTGRAYAPSSSDGRIGVRARLVHGRFAPCWGLPILSGCVIAAVGSVSGEASGPQVVGARVQSQFYAAGGVGVVSRIFVASDLLFLRAAVDVLLSAARAGFDVGEERIWSVPLVSAAATIGLGLRLP